MALIKNMFFVVALVLSALPVHGQGFYYHSTMPDGRVIVGDEPAPGAKDVKKVPLAKGNVSAPLSTPAQPGAASQQQMLDRADVTARQAQEQLQAAKAALEAAREPLPGERIGTAGGGSRLTEAYFERIKKLEETVSAAQRRVDDANSVRNSVR